MEGNSENNRGGQKPNQKDGPKRSNSRNRRRPNRPKFKQGANKQNSDRNTQEKSNTNSSSSSQENKPNRGNNQNRNSNPNRNRNNNRNRPISKKSKSRGRRPSNNSRRMKKIRSKPLTPEEKFFRSYENLFYRHEKAKNEYFAMFNRVDWRRRRKLELRFYETIEALRKFEDELEPWQRDLIDSKKWINYKLDITYSKNHELTGPEDPPPEEDIEDPMILQSQKNRDDYSSDEEESSGTYEDYERYKAAKSAY